MDAQTLLDRDGLFTAWCRRAPMAHPGQRNCYELDERGEVGTNSRPSARRKIVLTDVFCQLTEQIGHLAAMSVAVTTPSFGIRVPDVVWMPPERWEALERDDPVPFVPDLCVEVLLDRDRQCNAARRVMAYLAGGASEVIVVGPRGQVEFLRATGRCQASQFGIELSLDRIYFDDALRS